MSEAQPLHTLTRTLPVLVHIQTHLEGDLSLDRLADRASLSPYHFQRVFQSVVGESPKQYTLRLRLERAAFQLKIRQATILEIALAAGFRSHETFSRAFRRRFDMSPKEFRRGQQAAGDGENKAARDPLNRHTSGYQISSTTLQRIRPIPVAFLRNLGPYREVDVRLYERLLAWAGVMGWRHGVDWLVGVGHDDPSITPPEKLRFDACLPVPEPFHSDGDVGFQVVPGGYYAVTSYVGPYGATLEAAYSEIFAQAARIKGIEIVGLPLVEIYRTTTINPTYALNHTDVLIPVDKKIDE
jgi:AraC family transcriptional regulator